MSARFVFDGLAELRAQLRQLPAELTVEASRIVEANANTAAVDIRTSYGQHAVTSHLQRGLVVTHVDQGKYSAGALVKSTAPHATIFERGTAARHYITVNGVTHETGTMPAFNIFVPAMIRARRRMFTALADLLRRKGLEVSGTP